MKPEHGIKRLFKLLGSLLLFLADGTLETLRRGMGRKSPPRCVVLLYHSIPAKLRSQFARQMDQLLQWAQPIDAATTSDLARGGRYVAVTFDDAFENVLHNALPELAARQIQATVFVVTGCIGQPPSWMSSYETNGTGNTMSVDQLRNLPMTIRIGSHTVTHPVLTSLPESAAKKEITESQARLEELLGRRVSLFSFPHGAYNASLVRTCREAGYERVFTILPVLGLQPSNEYVTGRVNVEPSDWPLEFRLKVAGAYRWLPVAFALKRRICSRRG